MPVAEVLGDLQVSYGKTGIISARSGQLQRRSEMENWVVPLRGFEPLTPALRNFLNQGQLVRITIHFSNKLAGVFAFAHGIPIVLSRPAWVFFY